MKALLYKDVVTLKRSLLLLLVIITAVVMATREALLIPGFFILIPIILMSILQGYDDQAKFDYFVNSAPLSRRRIVLSKYVFIWSLGLVSAAITLIALLVSKRFQGGVMLFIVAAALVIPTVIATIQLPFLIKFGAEKGRLIMVLTYFITFAGFSYFGQYKMELYQVFLQMQEWSLIHISLGILGIGLIINYISLATSVKLYRQKEF